MEAQHLEKCVYDSSRKPLTWNLSQRQLCDLELILNGGFNPINGFINQLDYENILKDSRLSNGTIWPIPIVLDVSKEFSDTLQIGRQIILNNSENIPLAILEISDIWQPDKTEEANFVYNTDNIEHVGVNYLFNKTHDIYVGGKVSPLNELRHYDFSTYRKTPFELKNLFKEKQWQKIVAFQTRNPMHKAHIELVMRAANEYDANILINPVVGETKPGDVNYFVRVRCYEKIIKYFKENDCLLNLLPLAMRMAGPREALWHAIIRKNYGCTHFIVGRDHAGPGKDSNNNNFYDPYAAQEITKKFETELGIKIIPFQEMLYIKNKNKYKLANELNEDDQPLNISGTQLRQYLQTNSDIPEWFTYPDVVKELRKAYPPRSEQGFTVFFTGLSGAGKSTLANALMMKLMEITGRSITLLDGDIVRKNLSTELGFSRKHRDINVLRIGYVASEITKHRGIVICSLIAPYLETRNSIRNLVNEFGSFIEIYVNTPLEICELRDSKGLYSKAREGLIPAFTGISDPYEPPTNPELIINTAEHSCEAAVLQILNKLQQMGFIKFN